MPKRRVALSARRLLRGATVAGLVAWLWAASAAAESIPAAEAYARLAASGTLSSVTVTGEFDLGRLGDRSPPPGDLRISDVRFEGPVRLVGHALKRGLRVEGASFLAPVTLERCSARTLVLTRSSWAAPFVVRGCEFRGFTRLDANEYRADARFHGVRFLRRPSFSGSTFRGRAEFLGSEFGAEGATRGATSFSDVAFLGPVLFNNGVFHQRVRFQSAVFGGDASFLNVRMPAGASFRNVHFEGDAEFRFCTIGDADFGDRENLTVFAGRADFRGCRFAGARFDFADFRGETTFVNAWFGSGGASFRNATLGRKVADFGGVRVAAGGAFRLADASFPALRLYWRDVGAALLAAAPDARVLAAVHARLEASGDAQGALEASYHLARRRFEEATAAPLPAPWPATPAFFDALGVRLVRYGELAVWGWPTGYGTRLGRILLIALACWLVGAVAVLRGGRRLARVVRKVSGPAADSDAAPDAGEDAPARSTLVFAATRSARLWLALRFAFASLFRVGAADVRFVTAEDRPPVRRRWRALFAAARVLGSGLLVLVALTLANTSPMISRLVGELVP